MEKVLVTGGCGFIGSNFVRMLLTETELEVVNLDLLTYAGNPKNLRDIKGNNNYTFIKGDIADRKTVEKAMDGVDTVFNFAAESHVDNSIKNAEPFVRTNVHGTMNMLDVARNNNIEKFVQVSCYDEKTRALTTNGFKNFDELRAGNRVFSVNPATNEIEAKPIEKIIIQEYDGQMIHFNNKRVNLKVTPNHRMIILNAKKKILIESAEEAAERSIFFMPQPVWKGKDEEFCSVEGHGAVRTEDLFYLAGIFIGDGFTSYQEKKILTKSGLKREQFLEQARNEHGKFKALANNTGYETISKSHRIFFDIPENDKCRFRVETTLKNLGIKFSPHKGRAGTHVYFNSKYWLKFFEQFGKGAHNKKIPTWMLEYSGKYLKYLFEGLMDSDGHKRKIYHTVSKELVSGFCELCIKLGLKASIGNRHTVSFLNGRKIEGSAYYVVVSKTAKSISRHKIRKMHYKGKIWCLKVKDNKNFIVEREGKLDFCGNTDEVYGSVDKGSSTEEDRLEPRNPYSACKAAGDLIALSYANTYEMDVVVTRSSNNYGPYQYPEKLIPLFVTNILEGKKVPLYGTGKNIRDWLYVEDNCTGILTVGKKGMAGEIYNIGGGNELSNLEITKRVLKAFGKDEKMIEYVEDRKGHDLRYSLDSSKVKKLGWKPGKDFGKGLKETIEWYKGNEKWWKPLKQKR